jgi:hypothetical protein
MSEGLGTHSPDLFSKVGPLPAWAWGAIVIGGYLAYTHFTASSVPAAVDATDGTDNTADNLDTGDPSQVDASGVDSPLDPSVAGYSYGDVNSGDYGGTVSGTTFTSNQQWAVYAINGLVRQGYPVSTTTTAITYYLAGKPLTAQEASIVQAAISSFGTPPLPMPVTLVSTSPASSGTLPAPHVTGAAIAGHKARLTWNRISGAQAYQVDRVTPTGGTSVVTSPSYTTAVAWKPGKRLTFRVRAVTFTGKHSAWSNQVTVTIK